MKPKTQWGAIREVIAVDEPSPPLGVAYLPQPLWGMDGWTLFDPVGDRWGALLHGDSEAVANSSRKMFDLGTREIPGNPPGSAVPIEHSTIPVQGRELRCIRFAHTVSHSPIAFQPPGQENRSGPVVLVELPCEHAEKFLGFMMVTAGEDSRGQDAQVVGFLKPFHVGPNR